MNLINCSDKEPNPPILHHFHNKNYAHLKERPPVLNKGPDSKCIKGPYPLITWGREYGCVSTEKGPKWIPGKFIKLYQDATAKDDSLADRPTTPPLQNASDNAVAWRWRKKKTTYPKHHLQSPKNKKIPTYAGRDYNPYRTFPCYPIPISLIPIPLTSLPITPKEISFYFIILNKGREEGEIEGVLRGEKLLITTSEHLNSHSVSSLLAHQSMHDPFGDVMATLVIPPRKPQTAVRAAAITIILLHIQTTAGWIVPQPKKYI